MRIPFFRTKTRKTNASVPLYGTFSFIALTGIIIGGMFFSLPLLLATSIERAETNPARGDQFPVSVDPQKKLIVENAHANAFFERPSSPLSAAVASTGEIAGILFEWVALSIASVPWYQNLAAADTRLVSITPGMRKEQVATSFAKTLRWNPQQKQEFLKAEEGAALPLPEGSYAPGIYSVAVGTTPKDAQGLVNARFTEKVLVRYGPDATEKVPLDQALIIASLIEREAGGLDDMQLISGIIWNRLFRNMNLQIDATVQYAKANAIKSAVWWPAPLPSDLRRKSPYNTYVNPGLPPTPIANPSVAAIIAALNPKVTSCLFYFHDSSRKFHCGDTYAGHVALLKKFYGRGK